MKAGELAGMLARDAEGVARMLLPNGKREGHEWRAGSTDGDAGKSLGVHLTGQKAGIWSDFGTGEAGDLLDLWATVRGVGIGEACKQVADYLGVKEARVDNPRPSYAKPKREGMSSLSSAHTAWLTGERGLSLDSVMAYRLVSRGDEIVFPSLADGEFVAAKYRRLPKSFRVDANCEPVLFGWQAIPANARVVVIVEGELDAVAMHTMGWPALSVPFGGGTGDKQAKWIAAEFDRLAVFDRIYLALDTDGPGQEATAEIVKRLGRERCYVVELPHKDPNACLLAGMREKEIGEYFARAKTLDPEALRNAKEYTDEVLREFSEVEEDHGIRLPWAKSHGKLTIRMGEVVVLAGINGHGKSEVAGNMVVQAAHDRWRCCVASMEFRPQKWLKRMVRQACGRADPSPAFIGHSMEWLGERLWVFDTTGTAKADVILETFGYAAKRYGVELFVIDNLAKCGFAEDDYNGQKGFVDKLTDFAKTFDVAVILVAHMRKGINENEDAGKMGIKGSGAITDMVDTVLTVWRNKPKEEKLRRADAKGEEAPQEEVDKPDAVLTCSKQRNGEDEPRIALWFDPGSHQFMGSPKARPYTFAPMRVVQSEGVAI
ncbi:MAG: AAA family ATPase [Pseudomonadota bacterium]|nr:AAA family ATPase [Pseudomonadota bacterium]